jgi:DNA (cytosine-5)-methyltransferase 1
MTGNFISLFSGCGGSSLGYKLAGFKELLAIDFETNSVETFKLNFPDTPVWQKDIREVKGQEILDFCNIKKGELTILDGSPPCQGFSSSGKKEVNDSRNDLSFEFIRLVKEIEPKVFVMENVSGMIRGKMRGLFKEILLGMKELNYKVKCKLLDSKYYGVPQSRKRLFFIGTRKDLRIEPTFPEPNLNTISVRDAFKNVENKTYNKCKITPRQMEDRLNWETPSATVVRVANSIRSSCVVHPEEDRHLTIEEAKRLCSFPDNFKLIGSFSEQWARLGNAVMPKQMEAIAKHIKNIIAESEATDKA